jgi:hypothetical protein
LDGLDNPLSHPEVDRESDFTEAAMNEFASALLNMSLDAFEPSVDAEANDKALRVSHNAALSRRCLIQDASDFWVGPEKAVTGLGTLFFPLGKIRLAGL